MVVVSGEPRSGTSLMMLILKELGLPIAGEEFLSRGKDFNPTGIWEVKDVPYNGINTFIIEEKDLRGKVVKLATHGLLRSQLSCISHVIYCIRDPREIIVSQRNQTDADTDDNNYHWYNIHMCALIEKIAPEDWDLFHVVDYGDIMWSPKHEVERLCNFLGLTPTEEAIDAVKPEFYRSKKHKAKRNKTAEKYYRYLRGKI